MTDNELYCFGEGYNECRSRLIQELTNILANEADIKDAVNTLVLNLMDEATEEHWTQVKDKHPGKTKSEFEQQLVEFYLREKGQFLGASNQFRIELVRSDVKSQQTNV